MIYRLRNSDHITHALVSLYWLHTQKHIQFKVAILMYKALLGLLPQYHRLLTCVFDLPDQSALHSSGTNHQFDCQLSVVGHLMLLVHKSGTVY